MVATGATCPDCLKPVDYWRVYCRCSAFVGYPNRRGADAERADLMARYASAQADAILRRVALMLAELEQLAERSQPVINMSFAACDDMLRPGKYRNYDQRIDSGEREPAGAVDHGDRELVGQRLYPNYSQHIQYAALSPDGYGLEKSYGPVAVHWQVTPEYLQRRASLMEENSYSFHGKHSLGALRTAVPSGYQAVWEDRARLAAAKLIGKLTPAMGIGDLPALLLKQGTNRSQDEFIEIAIYADEGLDGQDIDSVRVQRPPASPDETRRCDIIREACARRPLEFIE